MESKEYKILILEDVPADAELAERELKNSGLLFIAKVVSTEKDFANELQDFHPDLILADYKLPGFDGLSALKIVKKMAIETPFIFVSGAIGEDFAVETFKKGATDYVLKNRLDRLAPAVKRAINDNEIQHERKKLESTLKQNFDKYRLYAREEKTPHILILEDTATDAELTEQELQKAGIKFTARRVETENDFRKALDLFIPDLILLDYALPNFNGLAALRIAKEILPQTPCIIVSGKIGEDLAIELLKSGATDYVLKDKLERLMPVTKRALFEVEERERLDKASEMLKQSEEWFRQIAENINEVFFLIDPRKKEIIYASAAHEKVFGLKPEMLYLNPTVWIEQIVPEDQQKMYAAFANAENQETGEFDFRVKHPDGSIRTVQSKVFPVKNERGEVYRIVGIAEDVTEKNLATKLQKEAEVAHAKEEFMFRTIHDLRTPSNGIRLVLENSREEKFAEKYPEVKENMELVAMANDRMNELIDNLLQIASGEKAELAPKIEPVDLSSLVKNILKELTPAANKKGVAMHYAPPNETTKVLGEVSGLREIFANLVDNAIKYNVKDGVVTISHVADAKVLKTVVHNTGKTISPEDLPKLFKAYFRADVTPGIGGTGLGLYIVKNLVEKMEGKVEVVSQPGEGTAFVISLPIATEHLPT